MKITAIETIPVRVPIHQHLAIRGKAGYHAVSPFLLVRVRTDAGVHGWGEVSCTPRWSGEDQVTAAHFIRTIFAPLLENQDPRDIHRLTAKMRQALCGHAFTKAAIEMALWDILGKSADLPVYRLLGGPVRDFVPTKWSVSGVEPDRAAEIAAWAVAQGFQAMKVKVGIDPEQDYARVRAVREAIGPLRLGIDANGAWNVATAIRMIRRLEDQGIAFAEQPVPPGDPGALAEVRRSVQVPIVADESVNTAHDAFQLARERAADVLSIYIGKAAGIGGAARIAAISEAAGLSCTVGSNLEMGVGSAALIHFAMSTDSITADFPCDIIGPLFYTDDLLQEPLRITGGQARPQDRPGLGVEPDEAKIKLYRVD